MTQIMTSTFRHLIILGIWPKDESRFVRKHFLCKFATISFLSSFLFWGGVLHFIMQASNETDESVVEDLVTIVGQLSVMYFNALFVVFYKKIAEIRSKLGDLTSFGQPKDFEIRNRQISSISRRFRGMILSFTIGVVLYPTLSTNECEESNGTKEVKEICGMVAPIWLPISFGTFPMKQIIIIWQAGCVLMNFVTASAVASVILETMENFVIRIQHLKQLIPVIIKISERQLRSQLFTKWVEYHVFIKDLGQTIDATFRYSLMCHATGTAIVLGLAGYSVMANKSTFSVLSLLCGWFLAFILVCISGQRLKNEAESIGASIYDSSWYVTPPSFQKQLLLAIIHSRKPMEIHAGPFTHLSHDLIVTVLKAAFSYINLLQAKSKIQT